MRRKIGGWGYELVGLFPPRGVILALIATLLSAAAAAKPLFDPFLSGVEVEVTSENLYTLGNAFSYAFGGLLREQSATLWVFVYLLMIFPIHIFIGAYLSRDGWRWQWWLAQRSGGIWSWWSRKVGVVLTGALLYRSLQMALCLLIGACVLPVDFAPHGLRVYGQIVLVNLLSTILFAMLQLSLQTLMADLRWPLVILLGCWLGGFALEQYRLFPISAQWLPGLWGHFRQSLEGGDSLGFSIGGTGLIELASVALLYIASGARIRRVGIAQMQGRTH
ncbi:MAG: hypothetical protein ACOYJA_10645 [Christensenellales bacterium]|jgi:hypothetical protein